MFRIVCDPSSGSIKLYLTEIHSGSLMFVVCLIGVWQRNFETVVYVYGTAVWELLRLELVPRTSYRQHTPLFQNYAAKHRLSKRKNISEPLRISVKYSFTLPGDGSHMIRNMSERSLILCLLKFLYSVDFNF